MADRRVRGAVCRRRQLRAGWRHDVAAAGLHPVGFAHRADFVDPRPAGRLGYGVGGSRCWRSLCCGRRPRATPLRGLAIAACRALAARLRADVVYVLGGDGEAPAAEHDAAVEEANAAVGSAAPSVLRHPYRPTGLGTAARMLVRLVDELDWLNGIIVQSAPRRDGTPAHRSACGVRSSGGVGARTRRGSTRRARRPARRIARCPGRAARSAASSWSGATRSRLPSQISHRHRQRGCPGADRSVHHVA